MKRKLLALILVFVMLVGCMGVLTACGGNDDPPPHEHKFDQKVTNSKFLKSAATTDAKAVYYYSCSCGEKGTNTFEHGDKLTGGGTGDPPPITEYPWDETQVIFQVNPNTNGGNLSSGTERYLEGNTDHDSVIDQYIDQRNRAAFEMTKVQPLFSYLNPNQYGWGAGIQYLFTTTDSDDAPDFYIFFIYDLVSASLKGSFANLFSQVRGANYFAFAEAGDEYVEEGEEEIGTGYMYNYMRSLTLSKYKMYVLASDYFIDLIRSFFVIPVNAELLAEINVDEATLGNYENGGDLVYNSDRTGDGQFDMADMYQLVYDMDWDYSALIQFSDAIKQDLDNTVAGWSIGDRLGFAMDTASGLPASGLVYTTSVVVINRTWVDGYWANPGEEKTRENGDYTYSYPESNQDLIDLFTNIATLMSSNGIAVVNNRDKIDNMLVTEYAEGEPTGQGMAAIRNRFADGFILFGGIVNVGGIESDTYQDMSTADAIGFGVVPVPLYKSYEQYVADDDPDDPNDNVEDLCKYQTQIHNNARAGAIGVKSKNFSQLSAYLNYQSLNSSDILEEYYTYELMIGATSGDQATGDMLAYIRTNVRSSFDKAFEDAIGKAFSEQTGEDDESSEDLKWHKMLQNEFFALGANIAARYESVRKAKAGYLQNLYDNYGFIGEAGGLPN